MHVFFDFVLCILFLDILVDSLQIYWVSFDSFLFKGFGLDLDFFFLSTLGKVSL
jgi:hypothetical protein